MTSRRYAGALLSSVLLCLTAGCAGTVAPKAVRISQPSWDGPQQNSGILAETLEHSFVVTAHFRDRYNSLVDLYGGAMKPALRRGEEISDTGTNAFLMTPRGMSCFLLMNLWLHEHRDPKSF